jgi:hypothetical protein
VYVAAFPSFAEKCRISTGGGCQAQWRKDGKGLFYLSLDGKLMAAGVKRSGGLEAPALRSLLQTKLQVDPFGSQYCVTGNGKKFIIGEPVEAARSLTVVINWTAKKKR